MAAVNERRERVLSESERAWLSVRSHLVEHRHELGHAAAAEYPAMQKAFNTPLLTRDCWIPARPLPLEALALEFRPEKAARRFVDPSAAPLPTRSDGSRYPSYSAAMAELAAPATFENRPTYRLLAAELTESTPTLTFGRGQYFDGLDIGEAAGHEYAGNQLGVAGAGLRQAIGDPTDLTRRPASRLAVRSRDDGCPTPR